MGEIAVRFLRVAQAWREEDQAAWDASRTQIGRALGMSLDEVACEIFAWLDEEDEA